VRTTLDWLGTATFRLAIGDVVVFLDTYMDRVPAAPPVGLTAAEVAEAGWLLIGHSHFDHIAGADVIAKKTGAGIIGSHESARVLREAGVPEGQIKAASGGERFRLAEGVTVRVFPGIHSCTWILTDTPAGAEEHGHTGLTEDERRACPGLVQRVMESVARGGEEAEVIRNHVMNSLGSMTDGGPLCYLIETPDLRIFWQDTSGCWTGALGQITADVAILAASGRPNVDGEPIQGSMAQFIAMEARTLQARDVFVGHHDNWMPPITRPVFEMDAVEAEMKRQDPGATLHTPGYLAGSILCD
jgi:L-ascorbate metabolism protein UlaG (beta-lactamase superfamily)